MSTHIRVERTDRVQRIVFDRQSKKNALTFEMYRQISEAIEAAEADPWIRVHVITGEGTIFTSGNDLADFLSPDLDLSHVLRVLTNLRTLKKPLVIAVNGAAIGVGVTMLMHADLVYAADTARFKTPFVDLGLIPEAGSSLLMPARMGHASAARMLLLGETFDAQQALAAGLLSEVLPAAELDAYAMEKAHALARRAPAALRQSKALMRRASAALLKETMDIEAEAFERCLESPELKEAASAFLQKRQPDFSAME